LGSAKIRPIKTRESAGIYRAGLTIDMSSSTTLGVFIVRTSSPESLKNDGHFEEILCWCVSTTIHVFRNKRYFEFSVVIRKPWFSVSQGFFMD